MWVKIIIIEAGERGGSVTYPRAVHTEKKKFCPLSVLVFIGGREDIHQALQLGCWERGGGSDSQLQLHWDFHREEREHIQTVLLRAGEGGCDGEGDHRQFTLFKRQSIEKVEQLPRQRDDGSMLFILNSFNRKAARRTLHEKLTWRWMAKLAPPSWLARSDSKRVARCLAPAGLQRLDYSLSNFEAGKKWANRFEIWRPTLEILFFRKAIRLTVIKLKWAWWMLSWDAVSVPVSGWWGEMSWVQWRTVSVWGRNMSFSARGSIPQEGVQGTGEQKNTRVKRAVRISSIVAQEVSFMGLCLHGFDFQGNTHYDRLLTLSLFA